MRDKTRLFEIIAGVLVFVVFIGILLVVLATDMQDESYAASMFSWHHEIEDDQAFAENKKVLEAYHVNRIYQDFSKSYIESPRMETFMKNASELGVSVICLAGDKNWVYDGLAEFQGIVDALAVYNAQAEQDNTIQAIALDEEFLLDCCDELSIMNYNKNNAATAIQTEYDLCVRYGIPIETIFELMPLDKAHDVTREITYHYDSQDTLQNAFSTLQGAYGPELGMGLHHFTVIKEKYLAEH